MTLPSSGQLGGTPTNAQFQGYIEAFRDVVSNQPGGAGRFELTIASGVVTPPARDHGGVFRIDTEGNAASDILDTIALTNVPDGAIFYLMAEDVARVVTLNHAAGGSGQMILTDAIDFVFQSENDFVMLQRRSTDLVEIGRRVIVDGVVPGSTVFGVLGSVQVFASSGSYTAPAGLRRALIEVVAGGGGGGGAATNAGAVGGGGGAGGYAQSLIDAGDITSPETVTVGTGGAAGVNTGGNGGAGGTSSFGAHVSCTGGSGGTGSTSTSAASSGGAGGTPTISTGTGIFAASGQAGYATGTVASAGIAQPSGAGGHSRIGLGGAPVVTGNGNQGTGYGAGGAGARRDASNNFAGGAGAAGRIVVWEYY
jgi:hypothetical protein